jgi:hypothetical protein
MDGDVGVGLTFQEAYCRRFNCSNGQYRDHVFKKSLYPHARLVRPVIALFWPDFFEDDFISLAELGSAESRRVFALEIAQYRARTQSDRNVFRKIFRLRISGKRLSALWRTVFVSQPAPSYRRRSEPGAQSVTPFPSADFTA